MLLLETDDERRQALMRALRKAGWSVHGVSSIAEVERWPDDLVITDARRFTMWWKMVGTKYVIVLADSPEEGADACAKGATLWVPRGCSPDFLASVIRSILAYPQLPGERHH